MKIVTNLNKSYIKALKNIKFRTFAVILEDYLNIPKETVVLPLPEQIIFFALNKYNSNKYNPEKIIVDVWNDSTREIKCREIQSGESITLTF